MKRVTSFSWHEKSFFLGGIMTATLFFVWAGMLHNPPSLAARAFAPSPGDGDTTGGGGTAGSLTIHDFSVLKDIGAQVYIAPDSYTDITLNLPTSHPNIQSLGEIQHSDVVPPTNEPAVLEATGQEPAWSKGKVSLTYTAEGASNWRIYTDPSPAHVPLHAGGASCIGDTTTQRVQIGIAGGEFEAPGTHTVICDIYTELILPEQLGPITLIAEVTDLSDDGDDLPPLTLGASRVAGSAFAQKVIRLEQLQTEKPASEKPKYPGDYTHEADVDVPELRVRVSTTAPDPKTAFQDYVGTELRGQDLCKKEVLSCMKYIKKEIVAKYHAFAHQIDNSDNTVTCVPTQALVKFTNTDTNTTFSEVVRALDFKGMPSFYRTVQIIYPIFKDYPNAPKSSATIKAWAEQDRKVHEGAHVAIVEKITAAAKDAIEKKVFVEFESILVKNYNYGVNKARYPFAKTFTISGGAGVCAQAVDTIAEQAIKNIIGSANDAYADTGRTTLAPVQPSTLLGREEYVNRVEDKSEGTLKVYAVHEDPNSGTSIKSTQMGSFDGHWHVQGGPRKVLRVGDTAGLHEVGGKQQIQYERTK